ncbi:hypothetical protein [Rossellomorea aquimaris]|uniref:Uncharacterized protein n=1 Tax=Rossellomorea aquimaris TaxID=189382 RepID=A0A1J6VZD7_9BACI|nr:hypothetical protein [Rossellomorea aquimaris]OIU71198.1 hypothetical protein BHE18_09155 [Rossellomorea aquimaris]
MYKADKSYSSIELNKEDIIELEDILTDKFATGNTRKVFTVNTKNREFTPLSLYGFLNDKVPDNIENITLSFREMDTDYSQVKYVRVSIGKYVFLSIEGKDEVWVNGMAQLLDAFFKKKKSLVLKMSNLIPILAGGLIGFSAGNGFFALKQGNTTSAIILGILLIIGFIMANPFYVRKVFPPVRLNLTPVPKRNWNLIWAATGAIGTIIGLCVAIISLWK